MVLMYPRASAHPSGIMTPDPVIFKMIKQVLACRVERKLKIVCLNFGVNYRQGILRMCVPSAWHVILNFLKNFNLPSHVFSFHDYIYLDLSRCATGMQLLFALAVYLSEADVNCGWVV